MIKYEIHAKFPHLTLRNKLKIILVSERRIFMNLEVEQYNNSLKKQRLRCSKTEAEFILKLENLEIGHFYGKSWKT